MDLQLVTILNALKGPPVSILLALISSARPMGTNDLVILTGWCESSVIASLHKLEMLGWVERLARYKGWVLIPQVRSSLIPVLFSSADPRTPPVTEPAGNPENQGSIAPETPEEIQDPGGNPEIQGSLLLEESEDCQDPAGNRVLQGSLAPEVSEDSQEPDGNCVSQGLLVYEPSHPFHLLCGNRESHGSFEPLDPVPIPDRSSSRESHGSRRSAAFVPPSRLHPPRRKHPASRVRQGSVSLDSESPDSDSLEEVNLSLKTQSKSSSDSDSLPPAESEPQICRDPPLSPANVPRILAATRQLFGERVMGTPEEYPDPARLLAAIAEAYQNRQNLRKPARVVFKNMRNAANFFPEYLDDPCAFLPESFLQAAGLPKSPSRSNDGHSRYSAGLPDYDDCEEEEPPDLPLPFEPHPSVSQDVGDIPGRTAAEAWSKAKSALESQLDRFVFSKYLARSTLARYDSALNLFTVAVEDAFTRDWLQERLAKLIGRLLVGICDRPGPVPVLFVTYDEVSEEIASSAEKRLLATT